MNNILWGIFLFLLIQRLLEMVIAKRNEKWMKARGAVEVGSSHYKYFIILHILFFISLFVEAKSSNNNHPFYSFTLLIIFILLQGFRIWCIRSLGKFWNTKIIVLPNEALIKTGPYKYFSHPNYFIVGMELFIIPLLFNAVFTAILFPILHTFIVITKRLPIENKALLKGKK